MRRRRKTEVLCEEMIKILSAPICRWGNKCLLFCGFHTEEIEVLADCGPHLVRSGKTDMIPKQKGHSTIFES